MPAKAGFGFNVALFTLVATSFIAPYSVFVIVSGKDVGLTLGPYTLVFAAIFGALGVIGTIVVRSLRVPAASRPHE